MLITVPNLEIEPLEFQEAIESGAIDYGVGLRQLDELFVRGRADLLTERRGPHDLIQDIRLCADYRGRFESLCARCLDPVEHTLEEQFELIFRPVGVDTGSSAHAISTSDTEIGYYQPDGLVLEDVLREQVLLSLPARALCRQDCKGLCPGCGRNLNAEICICEASQSDPRWTALADLRSRMKM